MSDKYNTGNSAYDAGFDLGVDNAWNENEYTNPYPCESVEYTDWNEGFSDGQWSI